LLHAAKTLVLRDFDEDVDAIIEIVNPRPGEERLKMLGPLAKMHVPLRGERHGEGSWRPAPSLPFGGIVGRARIVDVIYPGFAFGRVAPASTGERLEEDQGRWYAGGLALVLADVEPLPFVHFKGSLGFFDVPDKLIQEAAR
jgi:hypothetical protein